MASRLGGFCVVPLPGIEGGRPRKGDLKIRRTDWSESRRLCGDFDVIDGRVWFRDRLAHFAHGLEVCHQGILKVPARLFLGVANSDASGNIRRIGGVAGPCLLDDYWITSRGHFSPAFLSIAFNVP